MQPTKNNLIGKFLDALKDRTRENYECSLRYFDEFYPEGLDRFVHDVYQDSLKPPLEREKPAERVIRDFARFLKKQGYAPGSVRNNIAAVQSLLRYYSLPVSTRYIHLPRRTPITSKMHWTRDKILKFMRAARTFRNKAIILSQVQSGLASGDICNLKYGDVREEFEEGIAPVCLDLTRRKTGVKFMTFLGRDAVRYLKAYLETREEPKDSDHLLTRVSGKPLTPGAITKFYERIAQRTDLPFEGIETKRGQSYLTHPHTLRMHFSDTLKAAGCPELWVEFWMGHKISSERAAYMTQDKEEWRKRYARYEEFLAVELPIKSEISDLKLKKLLAMLTGHPDVQKAITKLLVEKGLPLIREILGEE